MTWLSRLLALGLLSFACAAQAQIRPQDLPPVDEVFIPTVTAPSRDRIEVHWKIADGYYLYRHRTGVEVSAGGFTARPLQLPKGKAYRDEFFGDVETYRGSLTAVLPGEAGADTDSVTLKVKYQGCADAGICYPPQVRSLTVDLPGGAASAANEAGGFVPLGSLTGGGTSSLLGGGKGGVDAAPLPQDRAFAVEAIAFDGNQLLLRFTPARGYYVYRDRTSMALEGAPGIGLQKPRWPKGQAYHDEHFGDVIVYFDQAEVPVPLVREHARAARATLRVTFQGCQTGGICYPPMTRRIALSIPAGKVSPPAEAAAGADAPAASPATNAAPMVADAAADRGGATPDVAANAATDVPRTLPPEDALRRASRTPTSLWLALLLALGGGLILNLMPCVLPVLSLKALSLASGDRPKARALWYTAGVLLSFLAVGGVAIALRAAGQALGWGFQLQQPLVIGVLVYVLFAVGLSLSGVFAIGYGLAGAGDGLARRHGPAGDFFTGVLAVVVASPCTAPFMGAALAFAFAASVPLALLVFLMLGVGLALPFLLIGFIPALANRLPRPGAWMETLKKALAFPMYLTAVWLLWVLGRQRGIDAVALVLVGLVLLALAAWWLQRLRWRSVPVQRALALLVLASAVAPLVMAHRLPLPERAAPADAHNSVAFSPERLAALRAEGKVVFVDITADWCVTCKANEKTVLDREPFRKALADADGVLMRGDWTNVDETITAYLEEHGAVGVPLYVVYPRNGGEGEVLPTVLTQSMVEDALARAAR